MGSKLKHEKREVAMLQKVLGGFKRGGKEGGGFKNGGKEGGIGCLILL